MPDFFFDRDDSLDRKVYAEFIQNILQSNERHRRDDSNGAYVLAIDSPWGTGKSRFAMMLKNHLEMRFPPSGAQIGNTRPLFYALYYDALSSDYHPDAMEPLMHAIMNSDVLKCQGAADDKKKLHSACVKILKTLGYASVRLILGEPTALALSEAEHAIAELEEDPLNQYQMKLEQYAEFRKTLSSAIRRTKRNLVIIVDELDRCKPTFAVQTIEMAKHLFDVKGLIFIFFLDITQLSCAVKSIYGSEMDATGYLCRYFDFISRLPTPDLLSFIKMKLGSIVYFEREQRKLNEAGKYMFELSQTFQLSLRDLSTIITNYAIMCNTVLKNYGRFQEHRLYLFLLTLKYKDLELYNLIVSDVIVREEKWKQVMRQYDLNRHAREYDALRIMLRRVPLSELYLPLRLEAEMEKRDPRRIIATSKSKEGLMIQCISENREQDNAQIVSGRNDSWGDALFYRDLVKWQKIKDITLAEYYSQQLDHFSFSVRT